MNDYERLRRRIKSALKLARKLDKAKRNRKKWRYGATAFKLQHALDNLTGRP